MLKITTGLLILMLTAQSAMAVRISASRIGYVDIERVFRELVIVEESRSHIRELLTEKKQELESGERAVGSLKERLELQKETLSPGEAAELEGRIRSQEEQLRELMEASRQEILLKERELKSRILSDIYETVKEISDMEGYSVMLEKDIVLYSRESAEDITERVIRKLNEKYK